MKKIYSYLLTAMMVFSFSSCANAQSAKFVKVQQEPADWSGTYLIVYEDDTNNQAIVFDGSLDDLDVKNNYIKVANGHQTINGEDVRVIEATDETNAAVFTISKGEGDGIYYIVSASGCGIGYNKFDTDPETGEPIEEPNMSCKQGKTYDNTIHMQEGKTNVIITAKVGYELRYNADEGKTRFRYHESGKKKAIKLYRKEMVNEDGTIVSISKPEAGKNTVAVYNVNGQQLPTPQKGLNIINGKKVVM